MKSTETEKSDGLYRVIDTQESEARHRPYVIKRIPAESWEVAMAKAKALFPDKVPHLKVELILSLPSPPKDGE